MCVVAKKIDIKQSVNLSIVGRIMMKQLTQKSPLACSYPRKTSETKSCKNEDRFIPKIKYL